MKTLRNLQGPALTLALLCALWLIVIVGLLALRPKYWRVLLRQAERRPFVRRQVRALAAKAAATGLSGPA